MDSVMFDAFNAHDLEKLKTLFQKILNFIMIKADLPITNLHGKFHKLFENNKTTGLRRDLVNRQPGSLSC